MASNTPSPKVSSRKFSWLAMVEAAWHGERDLPDPAYEIKINSKVVRTFDSTDRSNSGIYGTLIVECIMLEQQVTPAGMGVDCLLQEDGFEISQG